MKQVLVIAKRPEVRERLMKAAKDSGVSAEALDDFDPAIAQIEKEPPVLVLAEDPPTDEIMETLARTLKSRAPVTPLLLYLNARDSGLALKRMTEGAYDCLCPPLAPGDFLAAAKRAVSRLGRGLHAARPLRPPVAWWRRPVTFAAAGFVVFLALLAFGLAGLWVPPFQIYKLPSEHPVAAVGVEDEIWIVDWSQQDVARMHVQGDYVAVVDVQRFRNFQPAAVAVAPFYVYTASLDGRIRRHRKDAALSVTSSVPGPGLAPSGLAWDGDHLWSCDSESGKIYEYDAKLDVIAELPAPSTKPVGIAWHKGALWVGDGEHNALWRMEKDGAQWRKEGPFSLEIFSHNRSLRLSGFTIWKNEIWFVSEEDGVLVRQRLPQDKEKTA